MNADKQPPDRSSNSRHSTLSTREWLYLAELWAGIAILLVGALSPQPYGHLRDVQEWVIWCGLAMIVHAGIFSPHSDTMANYH